MSEPCVCWYCAAEPRHLDFSAAAADSEELQEDAPIVEHSAEDPPPNNVRQRKVVPAASPK